MDDVVAHASAAAACANNQRARVIEQMAAIGMGDGLRESDNPDDVTLDCNGKSIVIGVSRRSGRTIRTPARYQPTMDSDPYGKIRLADLDLEELAQVAEGNASDITSEGEEEEQDERDLDAELAAAQPDEDDQAFVKPTRSKRRLEAAFEAEEDDEFVPEPDDPERESGGTGEEEPDAEPVEDPDATESNDSDDDDDDEDDDDDDSDSDDEEEAQAPAAAAAATD